MRDGAPSIQLDRTPHAVGEHECGEAIRFEAGAEHKREGRSGTASRFSVTRPRASCAAHSCGSDNGNEAAAKPSTTAERAHGLRNSHRINVLSSPLGPGQIYNECKSSLPALAVTRMTGSVPSIGFDARWEKHAARKAPRAAVSKLSRTTR